MSISSRRIGAVVPCPTCQRDVLVPDRDAYEPAPAAVFAVAAAAKPPAAMPLDQPLGFGLPRLAEDVAREQPSQPPAVEAAEPGVPRLELRFLDGRRETLPLSRTAPVSIGAQSFNDVCIPESDVAPLHCRIGFIKTGFEVSAASPKGVEVNGTAVEHAILRPGDTLRIGSLDIVFRGEQPPVERIDGKRKDKPATHSPRAKPASREPSLFEGPVTVEPSSAEVAPESEQEEDRSTKKTVDFGKPGGIAGLLRGERRRPGEQEVMRSPLLLSLTIGASVLLMIALTIWFLMGREQRSRLLDLAETDLAEGKYALAVERYEEFLKRYPTSRMARGALIGAGKARVQKEISGAAPSWDLAWQRLDELAQSQRNTADYRDLQPIVRDFAEQISIGAARDAEATKTESLLEISAKARNLMENSADPDTPQTGPLELIRIATERAHVAIAKQSSLDTAVLQMQEALKQKEPITALSLRAGLLRQFPEFAKDSRIRAALQDAIAAEQKQIAVEEVDRAALTDDVPQLQSAVPAAHSRSRSDENSLGQVVYVASQDVVSAVDTITGELVWRRVTGTDAPFFPVTVRGAVNGVLMFDTRRNELVLCRAEDGRAVWRQPLDAPPLRAAPSITEGQLYLATQGGRLERIDLETGRLTLRIVFSQELAGSPVLSPDETHLFVAGDRGLIYAVRRNPLESAALTFTDHAPQTVRAPLTTLGRMLLVCENDRGDSAQLRLWDASHPDSALPEIAPSQRISGSVYEAPVLRGSHLVVSSAEERLAAFAVSDERGRMGLAPIGQYRLQDGYGGPQYVTLGPDQQFWVSSTAFRRFEIGADSLVMDAKAVALGLTAQPLQAVGETFFVGRRPFFGEAVVFTNIHREQLTGTWRLTVGARPRELLTGSGGGATLVTESGVVYRIGPARLNQGGFELAGIELEVPADVRAAPFVSRLSDGRVAIAFGGETPKLWLVDPEGRVSLGPSEEHAAECAPVLLDDGIVWPSAGRLRLRPVSAGASRFEEWRAEESGDDPPGWMWLVRTGGREFLSCDRDGVVGRFQVRTGDVPHIARVADVTLPLALDVLPVLLGDELAFVTEDGALAWLNVRSLDVSEEPKLPASVRAIWPANDRLLAQCGDGTACLVVPGDERKVAWTTPLGEFQASAAPHVADGKLWLAGARGEVVSLDAAAGQVTKRQQAPQESSLGVREIGGTLWFVAVDGALYRLQDLPEAPR